jgi:hypothetical protein
MGGIQDKHSQFWKAQDFQRMFFSNGKASNSSAFSTLLVFHNKKLASSRYVKTMKEARLNKFLEDYYILFVRGICPRI